MFEEFQVTDGEHDVADYLDELIFLDAVAETECEDDQQQLQHNKTTAVQTHAHMQRLTPQRIADTQLKFALTYVHCRC